MMTVPPWAKIAGPKARYRRKLDNISKVLSEIGKEVSGTSPDLIGLCEVENQQVVEELIDRQFCGDKGYGIVHFDSPTGAVSMLHCFIKNPFSFPLPSKVQGYY